MYKLHYLYKGPNTVTGPREAIGVAVKLLSLPPALNVDSDVCLLLALHVCGDDGTCAANYHFTSI